MKKEAECPLKFLKDKEIMEEWGEHFSKLLEETQVKEDISEDEPNPKLQLTASQMEMKSQRKKINELVKTNQIPTENWIDHLTDLYKAEDTEEIINTPEIVVNENIEIEESDVQLALHTLKNRKNPGQGVLLNTGGKLSTTTDKIN
ncbi:hypothetical protein ILUMI_26280 [Ignelater luminosus]|uniref:Uncharacterized protein n=1 Tax=Ignelater luminosus TaxID=2038154 RepID=A0A8K0FVZ1_IGNLU|nr:hypothetical protein ILUMI_26280 [Ignelater luminosus]